MVMNTVTGASWSFCIGMIAQGSFFFTQKSWSVKHLRTRTPTMAGCEKILAAGVICQTVVSQGSTDPGAKVWIRMFDGPKWGCFFSRCFEAQVFKEFDKLKEVLTAGGLLFGNRFCKRRNLPGHATRRLFSNVFLESHW